MSALPVLLTAVAAAPQTLDPKMTTGGWIFLGLGWLFVGGLALWCFRRVLGGNDSEG